MLTKREMNERKTQKHTNKRTATRDEDETMKTSTETIMTTKQQNK